MAEKETEVKVEESNDEVKMEDAPFKEIAEEAVDEAEAIAEGNIQALIAAVEATENDEVSVEEVEDDENEGIFITEHDTFDISIKWYKDALGAVVEGESENFDPDHQPMHEFTVTFKLPSQGDYEAIMASANEMSIEHMRVADIIRLEVVRLITLVRSWSLKQDMKSRMVQLDPNIIKAMLAKVRDTIGMRGIL